MTDTHSVDIRCTSCGAMLRRWHDGRIGCPDFCGHFGPGDAADPVWLEGYLHEKHLESEARLRAELSHVGLWRAGKDGIYREFRGDDIQGVLTLLDEARKALFELQTKILNLGIDA